MIRDRAVGMTLADPYNFNHGIGCFGEVRLGTHKVTGEEVAVNIVRDLGIFLGETCSGSGFILAEYRTVLDDDQPWKP